MQPSGDDFAMLTDLADDMWLCPYCGKEHASERDGSDVICCGELGHAYLKGAMLHGDNNETF